MGEAEVDSLSLTRWTNIMSPDRTGLLYSAWISSSHCCVLHASSDVNSMKTSSVLKMHGERLTSYNLMHHINNLEKMFAMSFFFQLDYSNLIRLGGAYLFSNLSVVLCIKSNDVGFWKVDWLVYLKTECTNLETSDEDCLREPHLKPGMFSIGWCDPILLISWVLIDAIKKVLCSKFLMVVI